VCRYLSFLKTNGKLVMVGASPEPLSVHAFNVRPDPEPSRAAFRRAPRLRRPHSGIGATMRPRVPAATNQEPFNSSQAHVRS
jgi:hypothetical protein